METTETLEGILKGSFLKFVWYVWTRPSPSTAIAGDFGEWAFAFW